MTVTEGVPQPVAPSSGTPELLLEFARAAWLNEWAFSVAMNIVYSSAGDNDALELRRLDFKEPAGVACIVALWLRTKAMKLYVMPTLVDAYTTEIKTLTALENVINDPPLPYYAAAAPVSSAPPRLSSRRSRPTSAVRARPGKRATTRPVGMLETAELALLPKAKAAVEETGFDGSEFAIALQATGFHIMLLQ